MATTSEVKSGLDGIAGAIADNRKLAEQVESILITIGENLAALPATYADELATIGAFTPTGTFESLSQDELAKLTTEFGALQTSAANALAAITA